jgi:hypothetical protein
MVFAIRIGLRPGVALVALVWVDKISLSNGSSKSTGRTNGPFPFLC